VEKRVIKVTRIVQARDSRGRFTRGRILQIETMPAPEPKLSEFILPLWEANQRYLAMTPTDFRRDVYTRVHV
jgi:hypothetical protein